MSFALSKAINARSRAAFDLLHMTLFETGITPKLMRMYCDQIFAFVLVDGLFPKEVEKKESRLSPITYESFASLLGCYLFAAVTVV